MGPHLKRSVQRLTLQGVGQTRLRGMKPPHPDEPCTTYSAAVALAPQLDGSSAGELISELVRYGLEGVIELEVAAV